jgi:hypothetical protein
VFYNGYRTMKLAYALAIRLSDLAERFEKYTYYWLDTFEAGHTWE